MIHPQGEIFPGSPLCFWHLGALSSSLPVCTNLELGEHLRQKLLFGILGQIMIVLLVYYQLHRPCMPFIPAFLKQSSTMDLASWISVVSQPPTPKCRETDPTHDQQGTQLLLDCHGQSCLRYMMHTLALFR